MSELRAGRELDAVTHLPLTPKTVKAFAEAARRVLGRAGLWATEIEHLSRLADTAEALLWLSGEWERRGYPPRWQETDGCASRRARGAEQEETT